MANIKAKQTPTGKPHSGLTISEAIKLSGMTKGRLSYGKVMHEYGGRSFKEAVEMAKKKGDI